MVKAYEARIENLKRERLVLEDQDLNLAKPKRDLGEVIEPALEFPANS